MKAVLAATIALFVAAPALGGGMNLAWTECLGGGGTSNRSFACNTNAGMNTLVVSFEPEAPMSMRTVEALIELHSDDATTLNPWWQLYNAGSCRPGLPTTSVVFPHGGCADPWQGSATSGSASPWIISGNRASMMFAASSAVPVAVAPGTEYYALNVHIDNSHTVGTPSCAGCLTGVCLVLTQVVLGDGAGTVQTIRYPLYHNCAAWQGGTLAGCCITPARNQTWGEIKALYR